MSRTSKSRFPPSARQRPRLTPLSIGLLTALALLGGIAGGAARHRQYTTSDEPVHLAAAREMRTGPGVVSNLEHPVLMKVIAAAGLRRARPDRLITETRDGRLLFPLVTAGLVLLSGLWATTRVGLLGGLAAGALVLVDPTVRGHSTLVQSDALLALFLLAAGFFLDVASRDAGRARVVGIVASGVSYGLAIASKYSALPFLVVFAGAAFLRLRSTSPRTVEPVPGTRRRAAERRRGPSPAPGPGAPLATLALLAVALGTGALVQQAALAGTSREDLEKAIWNQFGGPNPLPQQAPALRMASRLPKGMAAYAAGLYYVEAAAAKGVRFNYLFGEISPDGFLSYFPVALLVKLPAAVLLATAAALAVAASSLARASALTRRRRLRVSFGRAFVPGVLALGYLGAAMVARLNIGVRHVLPVIPLGIVAAVSLFTPLLRSRRVRTALLAAAVAGSALEAGARWGREIPFGNVFVGGPGPGLRRVLSDSNVDWGEAQGVAFDRARRGDLGRVGILSLFVNPDDLAALKLVDLGEPGAARAVDTAIVSVFLFDVAKAIDRPGPDWPKKRWLQGWLPPVIREVEAKATSVEPLGDEYLLFRLAAPPR